MAHEDQTTVPNPEAAVLLADGIGGYFAVPVSSLDQHRLSDAQLEAIRRRAYELELTGEVTGYGVGGVGAFLSFGSHGGGPGVATAAVNPHAPGYGLDRPQFPCPPGCQWIANLAICITLTGRSC